MKKNIFTMINNPLSAKYFHEIGSDLVVPCIWVSRSVIFDLTVDTPHPRIPYIR